jgi:hypothetical protein
VIVVESGGCQEEEKEEDKEKQEEEEDGLMWVLVLCSPGEGLEGLKALEQGGNVDESPVEQVRLIVPNTDDSSLAVWTFRMWTIGLLFCF